MASHFYYQNAPRRIKVPTMRGRASLRRFAPRARKGSSATVGKGDFLVMVSGGARQGREFPPRQDPFEAGWPAAGICPWKQ